MKDFINDLIYIAMFCFGYWVKQQEVKQQVKLIKQEIEKLRELLKIKQDEPTK